MPDQMSDHSTEGSDRRTKAVATKLLPISLGVAGFCLTQLILDGLIQVVVGIPYHAAGEPAWLFAIGLVLGLVALWPSFLAARWLSRFAKSGFQTPPPG